MDELLKQIDDLCKKSMLEEGHFNSMYEGYAAVLAKTEEAWDAIKKENSTRSLEEMKHVAALALKYLRTYG